MTEEHTHLSPGQQRIMRRALKRGSVIIDTYADAYRAGAEAMRERAEQIVEQTPCPGEADDTETGHRYAAGYRDASNAARDELNRLLAAIRALPIPPEVEK